MLLTVERVIPVEGGSRDSHDFAQIVEAARQRILAAERANLDEWLTGRC